MGFEDFFSPTIHVLQQATCPQDNSACILKKIIFLLFLLQNMLWEHKKFWLYEMVLLGTQNI